MPRKQIEQSRVLTVRMTDDLYSLVTTMARRYGNNADVLRAGVMALWREFNALPGAEGQGDDTPPDAPDA